MSHPAPHDEDSSVKLRPPPRHPFELGTITPPSIPSTPREDSQSSFPPAVQSSMDGTSTPSRTRSIINLTSSTLFGIYNHTGFATDREEPSTPWGTGAQTPMDSRRSSMDLLRSSVPEAYTNGYKGSVPKRKSTAPRKHSHNVARKGLMGYYLPLLVRTAALFAVGVSYGLLISHLHDRQGIAPVKVEGINRSTWPYFAFWGTAGVLLGHALPYADAFWATEDDGEAESPDNAEGRRPRARGMGAWNDVVRSIGAFVGIAFAIRKLPWQSTLQLSLTLALANPALWYLVDRSPPGFILSAVFSLTGTAVLLGINPALVPSPSPAQVLHAHVAKHAGVNATAQALTPGEQMAPGYLSQESVGVATWIASVLFVSSVCFGNIGRRLAPRERS